MIIGLHGKMGSGKNTAAERLALIAPHVVEVSFARKLKESAAALLGCTVADLERWKNEPFTVTVVDDEPKAIHSQTVRSFLQRYGTEAHRDVFGQDFWLDAALPLVDDVRPGRGPYGNALYVVTDVRFENEAKRVRDLGGIVVQVIGPVHDTGNHASEQEIDCDYHLFNLERGDGFATLDCNLRTMLNEAVYPALAA